ncbi:galactokinase [Methylocystis bryophila]|uniref:Galactokinase n=1 Tax=Methylocystis bryophila TaxID=655015 RepID=A0A1W6MXQ1_9HYPH|nr:galactokinase [Methylocystis bryophila]ARN82354.1 galactokinase [Methylocystis bryophila]BDV38515.1 galactokinase [Methylocystis bryophila]
MNCAIDLQSRFVERFGGAPRLFRAPGRVNLIGEHTDYNDGFVLPAAIDLATYAAVAPCDDRRFVVHSLAYNETVEFDLDAPPPAPRRHWSDYVFGVVLNLQREGFALCGADMMLAGDLPMGAGLSASAALEVVVGYALCDLCGVSIERKALALLCQRAENEFVGMRCGVMDQLISCCGVADHALLIDCRSLETRPAPLDPKAQLVICNTMVSHELASSEYNKRRAECERAVELLSPMLKGVRALRDVSPEQLALHGAVLPDVILRRARHVVTENARTLAAAQALEDGDLPSFGRLMNASHASLRDDYEVSCAEADVMVDLAQKREGVFGARMTGGGFGGSTLALVEAGAAEHFMTRIGEAYRKATGLTPQIFRATPSAGVQRVMVP